MTPTRSAPEILHPAFAEADLRVGADLDTAGGAPLERARLGDQQRLAVVFQGAAVLAHLWHLGRHLGEGLAESAWDGAEILPGTLLRLPASRPGPAADLPQAFLFRLLQLVFHAEEEIVGRGPARRIARHLWAQWRQTLTRVPPDLAVGQVLESAPFLWSPTWARQRHYLGCEFAPIRGGTADGGESELGTTAGKRLWVAGPGPARQRLLDGIDDAPALRRRLGSEAARDHWQGFEDGADPWDRYRAGRWHRAAILWQRKNRLTSAEALGYARSLMALGRSNQALGVLARRRDVEGTLLRAWCQFHLAERHAATRTLHRLEDRWQQGEVSEEQLVQVTELAVRLCAGRGDLEGVRSRIARVLALRQPRARLAGLLAAAGGAWDLDELEIAGQYLEDARPALDDPALAHRWHQAEGLRRLALGDAHGAVEHIERALGRRRRRCGRYEAARLWADLTVARTAADDLPGAERAARHAVRLGLTCEGPSTTTLAFHNLAELRVRRGRFRGVEAELEQMVAANRRSGNHRGLLRDLELWCRFRLALGRPHGALAAAAEARDHRGAERSTVFDLFCARAHGWLGHAEKALAHLETGADRLDQLEPEERPAVWALAGDDRRAARAASGGPWEPLWSALLGGQPPSPGVWRAVDSLEPYRAARLVFDVETYLPGSAPPSRVRRAVHTFRSLGADDFAQALDGRASRPWQALRQFCQSGQGLDGAAELLREAGYPEARIVLRQGEEVRPIVAGAEPRQASTEERRVLAVPAGRWRSRDGDANTDHDAREGEPAAGTGVVELSHAFVDPALEALLAVVASQVSSTDEARLDAQASRVGARSTDSVPTSNVDSPGEDEWRPTYHEGIIGRSTALVEALSRLDRLAVREMPILILGESGTGKELMARRVHAKSPRASGPFVPLNCAAVSESLIQSELFGHVRGAFTGADRDRPGIFESARGGTVFLDEIGDLPPDLQPKLLRVLQEKEIRRVGESMPRKIDVRVVAATHRDLERRVEAGEFRRDLFYRLKAARVVLPALREREDDVQLLAEFFLKRLGDARLSPAAARVLDAHDWPGNIRELQNELEVAAALAAGEPIKPEHLDVPDAVREAARSEAEEASAGEGASPARQAGESAESGQVRIFDREVLALKRRLVVGALEASGGNKSRAARSLGMTRQHLSYLIKTLFDDDPLKKRP